MFAYTYSRYGAPEVLELTHVPKPTPKPKEVLVKIHATTVSAGDWRARSLTMPKGMALMGRMFFGVTGPRKPILGTEFSGVIEAVGAEVTAYAPGDAVIGFPGANFGAHAEYIVMPEAGKLVPMPDNLSFAEAASLPFGGTTAFDFLVNKAGIKAGEAVLINGASGAVGSACVQIAKHLGAHVTAVCSGKNAGLVRSLGADEVIDYTQRDFMAEATLFDAVVDTVATAPFNRVRHVLRPKGRLVMVAGSSTDLLFGAVKALFYRRKIIGGVASEAREILQAVVDLAAEGQFQPVIDRCYSFDAMQAAHAHMDTGRKKGAVVVSLLPEALENGPKGILQQGAA
ncbi:NAD(P)-dependent alcohol dehydrogenase [Rhodobacteraceae bacterium M385]|nr:NAD(P)-dependent alcohol dehydrogenase [Rhodobacteraceae bacterium M385]